MLELGVDLLALLNRHLSASNQLVDQLFALFGANGNRTDACQENTLKPSPSVAMMASLVPQMDVPRGDTRYLFIMPHLGRKGKPRRENVARA